MYCAFHLQRPFLIGNNGAGNVLLQYIPKIAAWRRKLISIHLLNTRFLSSQGDSSSSSNEEKRRLFKVCPSNFTPHRLQVARVSKRIRTYDSDKIDQLRAMAEFGLK